MGTLSLLCERDIFLVKGYILFDHINWQTYSWPCSSVNLRESVIIYKSEVWKITTLLIRASKEYQSYPVLRFVAIGAILKGPAGK